MKTDDIAKLICDRVLLTKLARRAAHRERLLLWLAGVLQGPTRDDADHLVMQAVMETLFDKWPHGAFDDCVDDFFTNRGAWETLSAAFLHHIWDGTDKQCLSFAIHVQAAALHLF